MIQIAKLQEHDHRSYLNTRQILFQLVAGLITSWYVDMIFKLYFFHRLVKACTMMYLLITWTRVEKLVVSNDGFYMIGCRTDSEGGRDSAGDGGAYEDVGGNNNEYEQKQHYRRDTQKWKNAVSRPKLTSPGSWLRLIMEVSFENTIKSEHPELPYYSKVFSVYCDFFVFL